MNGKPKDSRANRKINVCFNAILKKKLKTLFDYQWQSNISVIVTNIWVIDILLSVSLH